VGARGIITIQFHRIVSRIADDHVVKSYARGAHRVYSAAEGREDVKMAARGGGDHLNLNGNFLFKDQYTMDYCSQKFTTSIPIPIDYRGQKICISNFIY
jgi:hypothetical protein